MPVETRTTNNSAYKVKVEDIGTESGLNIEEGAIYMLNNELRIGLADGTTRSLLTDGDTGWAQYTDDQYTSSSPLVVSEGATTVLDINGASTIKSQLPEGVTDFYNVSTSKILGVNSGDGFLLRVAAQIFTSSPSGLAKLKLDIGGSQGVILNRAITFPKGTGLSNASDYNTTSWYYTLGTFVANGGELQLESVTGDTSIYDISINIARVHKAR